MKTYAELEAEPCACRSDGEDFVMCAVHWRELNDELWSEDE